MAADFTTADIKAAIFLEGAVRRHGACLFVDTNDLLSVIYLSSKPLSPQLEKLLKENFRAIIWLIDARAAE